MRLLLAEDEPGLARALSTILEHSGYEVEAVGDGLSAFEHLKRVSYDAAILDIMMPGIDGIEVLRRTRALGNTVPIIMLTAKGEVEDKVAGLDAGANDYLAKPFAAKELLARLRVMTRSAAAVDASTLAAGDLRLDIPSCELTGPSGSVHLANLEFRLLRHLMERSGERVPTERLLVEVWGDQAPDEASVVWVYISNLRKRLAAIGSTARITAARNQGYALEAGPEESGDAA